jgi:hypothetical protein
LRRTTELSDVRSRIAAIKEAALQSELKDKDLKIAEASNGAAAANKAAGEANERETQSRRGNRLGIFWNYCLLRNMLDPNLTKKTLAVSR